jgi:hypothetical protein
VKAPLCLLSACVGCRVCGRGHGRGSQRGNVSSVALRRRPAAGAPGTRHQLCRRAACCRRRQPRHARAHAPARQRRPCQTCLGWPCTGCCAWCSAWRGRRRR